MAFMSIGRAPILVDARHDCSARVLDTLQCPLNPTGFCNLEPGMYVNDSIGAY